MKIILFLMISASNCKVSSSLRNTVASMLNSPPPSPPTITHIPPVLADPSQSIDPNQNSDPRKLADSEFQYPSFVSKDGSPSTPPITVLPPRFVTPEEAKKISFDGSQLQIGQPLVKKKRRLSRRKRHLQNFPFMNLGKGILDLASSAFPPLSLASMIPGLSSRAPALPQPTPPPPIRIQLRDPIDENYQRNVLSESERVVQNMEESDTLKQLQDSVRVFNEELDNNSNLLKNKFKEISDVVESVQKHQDSVKRAREDIKFRIEELKKKQI